ncbi:MAG: hypothetical protein U5R14_09535 [Gemmatimonadota bacterium]|nr:hypothetical protein [Gemmatimonadota bacterium]
MTKKLLCALAVVGFVTVPTSELEAQSLFNSAGLGRPVDAIDGRARAMGSFGIGLRGGSISPADPAATAWLARPSGVMVAQPSWTEASRDGVDAGDFRGTRFPLVGIAYPVLGGMGRVQLGSFLDQRFEGQRTLTVELGGTAFDVVDGFTQDGGVATASLGYSRMISPDVAVGLDVARYTGSVQRRLSRDFGDLDLDGAEPFTSSGSWRYAGTSVTAGVGADLGSVGRAAASVRWSSTLEADPSSTTDGSARSFDLPLELRIGGSAVLAPGLVLAASAMHADWSDIADDLMVDTSVGNASGFGVGLELPNVRLLGRSAPLRFGYRYSGLPFAHGQGESGSERAFTGGLGFAFNETNGVLLAGADVSVERGERSAGTLSEDFWRVTVALRVAGF